MGRSAWRQAWISVGLIAILLLSTAPPVSAHRFQSEDVNQDLIANTSKPPKPHSLNTANGTGDESSRALQQSYIDDAVVLDPLPLGGPAISRVLSPS